MRKIKTSKKSVPGQSTLSRNAEINMFTGFEKGRPGKILVKEVDRLRSKGVMAIIMDPNNSQSRRYSSPWEGGERRQTQSPIQPVRVRSREREVAPWDFVDQKKTAREDFKKQQYAKQYAAQAGAPWTKHSTEERPPGIVPPQQQDAPWMRHDSLPSGKRIYDERTSGRQPAPWTKKEGHNPQLYNNSQVVRREQELAPWMKTEVGVKQ